MIKLLKVVLNPNSGAVSFLNPLAISQVQEEAVNGSGLPITRIQLLSGQILSVPLPQKELIKALEDALNGRYDAEPSGGDEGVRSDTKPAAKTPPARPSQPKGEHGAVKFDDGDASAPAPSHTKRDDDSKKGKDPGERAAKS